MVVVLEDMLAGIQHMLIQHLLQHVLLNRVGGGLDSLAGFAEMKHYSHGVPSRA